MAPASSSPRLTTYSLESGALDFYFAAARVIRTEALGERKSVLAVVCPLDVSYGVL